MCFENCQTKFRSARSISSLVNILLTSMRRRRKSMWKSVFPVHEFDTGEGTKHLLKEQLKRQRRREHSLFSSPHDFLFYADRLRPREAGILKRWYGQQRKAATRDEIFFFFPLFIIIIFEVPTNAGGVSYGRTGRTLERAGSGSHLDVEERTVRASLSLWPCLRNQSRWIELRDEEWSGIECSEEISQFCIENLSFCHFQIIITTLIIFYSSHWIKIWSFFKYIF